MVTNTKQGYKQTELGLVPEDWRVIHLSEIGKFKKGKGLKKEEIIEDGIPCIRYGEIYTHHNNYIKQFFSFIPPEISDSSQRIVKGDLLFTGSGETAEEIGKCVAFLGDEEAYAGGDIIIFSPYKDDPKFLGDLMNHPLIVKQKSKMAQGDAIVHIYSKNLGQLVLVIPSNIEEQSAISSVLSDMDLLIESVDKLIEKKKNIKQGVMQELLTGKKRLRGFNKEWAAKKLGDITKIKTGKKNNEDKTEDGLYPFFVRSQTVERIDSYSFDGEAILIPGEGGIGNIFHYINGKFDYHQRVYKISDFVENVCGKFIYYYMMQNFYKQAMKHSVKATVDSLRLPTFQEFEMKIPEEKQEQLAIAQVLSDIDEDINRLERKRDKYRQLKVGSMQQLLTGRIRLKWKS